MKTSKNLTFKNTFVTQILLSFHIISQMPLVWNKSSLLDYVVQQNEFPWEYCTWGWHFEKTLVLGTKTRTAIYLCQNIFEYHHKSVSETEMSLNSFYFPRKKKVFLKKPVITDFELIFILAHKSFQ